MKTSTSLLIAAGAIIAVVGVGSAVNAESGRGDAKCGDHAREMRGPGHDGAMRGPMRGPMGGPMQGMMGEVVIKRFFETADTDKDGKLSEQEIETARNERFESNDTNGDGKLTLVEFEALFRDITQPVTVRVFQFLDPDGDAMISKEEFDRPTSRFVEHLDRDGDGMLSPGDRRGGFHRSGFHGGREHGKPQHGGYHQGRYDEGDRDDN